jgi:hypothetical protein
MIFFTEGFDQQLFESISDAARRIIGHRRNIIQPDCGALAIIRDPIFDILTVTEVVHTAEVGTFETLGPYMVAVKARNERTERRGIDPIRITFITDARLRSDDVARLEAGGIQQILPRTGFDPQVFIEGRFPQGQAKEGSPRVGW